MSCYALATVTCADPHAPSSTPSSNLSCRIIARGCDATFTYNNHATVPSPVSKQWPKPYTLHPTPYMYPAPYMYLTPYTLHPTPSTQCLNSEPHSLLQDCHFSFAGLKTAVRLAIQKAGGDLTAPLVNGTAAADIAASFQVCVLCIVCVCGV